MYQIDQFEYTVVDSPDWLSPEDDFGRFLAQHFLLRFFQLYQVLFVFELFGRRRRFTRSRSSEEREESGEM